MTRFILTGGGTGGHIYPALAIAGGLRRRWPQAEILYTGAKNSMESRVAREAGYAFHGITAEGWQGRKAAALSGALKASYKGKAEAMEILSSFKPLAVIGTGGYVCLPVAAAAVQKRIPVYIHEQNAFPGMTNRFISLWAKRIMVSFEEAAARFPALCRKRIRVTGLPVREAVAGASREEALNYFGLQSGKKTIFAAGGSQGAQSINRAMLHVIKSLHGKEGIQVLLAAGRRDFEEMAGELKNAGIPYEGRGGAEAGAEETAAKAAREAAPVAALMPPAGGAVPGDAKIPAADAAETSAGVAPPAVAAPGAVPGAAPPAIPESNIRMLPYIDRMDLAYAAADIFAGRAGASTLAEITLCRLPAILIPYPFASGNHQLYNAMSLADKGGAVLLEDRRLTGPVLLETLLEILNDENKYGLMAEKSFQAARSGALEDILDILAETIE